MAIRKFRSVPIKNFVPRKHSLYKDLYNSVERGQAFTEFICDDVAEAKRFVQAARNKGFEAYRNDEHVFLRYKQKESAANA